VSSAFRDAFVDEKLNFCADSSALGARAVSMNLLGLASFASGARAVFWSLRTSTAELSARGARAFSKKYLVDQTSLLPSLAPSSQVDLASSRFPPNEALALSCDLLFKQFS
jgi:hypothetical protein